MTRIEIRPTARATKIKRKIKLKIETPTAKAIRIEIKTATEGKSETIGRIAATEIEIAIVERIGKSGRIAVTEIEIVTEDETGAIAKIVVAWRVLETVVEIAVVIEIVETVMLAAARTVIVAKIIAGIVAGIVAKSAIVVGTVFARKAKAAMLAGIHRRRAPSLVQYKLCEMTPRRRQKKRNGSPSGMKRAMHQLGLLTLCFRNLHNNSWVLDNG